jgi:mannose-1-phosphate guanylyltransferase/mannose-6-phosphate isomerase-like protein (cupin superfamily)
MTLHPVILAGGSGTRLWPLSRQHHPKQFLALLSERSLLQETVSRLDGLHDVAPPIFVCNEEHRFLAAHQIKQLGKTPAAIILEPVGRNTAPALTLAALMLTDISGESHSDDPIMVVMPSDHVIRDVGAFQSVVQRGAALAEGSAMVAVGIVPRSPNVGYGYIRKGEAFNSPMTEGAPRAGNTGGSPPSAVAPSRVAAFVEKPDKETAEKMLEAGDYLWNSGIFILRASTWLEQLRKHRPDIAEICTAANAQGQRDGDYYRPDATMFASCPGDFVAYSIMEKASGGHGHKGPDPSSGPDDTPDCIVIPMDAGWSDVGSWSSLWDAEEKDSLGNAIKGDVDVRSTRNSLVMGQHRRVIADGLEDMIVVETADAVLVAHKDHMEDLKVLVQQPETAGRPEHEGYGRVHRPWGSYETIDSGPGYHVRRLTLNPRAAVTLHMHRHRAEHWVVLKGSARISRGDEETLLTENQSTSVSMGIWHRLENAGTGLLELFEVQSGSYLGEDDIVRPEDNRV